ncbi:MAG: alkaline phosphatase family protein [Chloroflexi bacterium]|nr:alkaline phosphatase family protein [Chloroflexota bacterium]
MLLDLGRAVRRMTAGRIHFSVAAALYLTLFTMVVAAGATVLHNQAGAAGQAASSRLASAQTHPRYLVLFVLDGARPDYFGLTRLPHVDALRAQGTQYTNAIDGILESETPAGHTTLATGSTPRRDGILGFNWAQNDNDFSLFSPDVIRAGAMERIMQQAGTPTIAGLYKARFPRARVVALSGHKYYAADPLGGPSADAIMYYQGDSAGRYVPVAIPGHVPPAGVLTAPGLIAPSTHLPYGLDDALATRLALSAFRVMHQRLTLINEPEFDWPLGHVDGGSLSRARVITLMQSFDRDLGLIEKAYRKAGILDRTLFVITADHGMAPVTHFIASTVITNAVARARTTAPSIAYNSAAYVWIKDASKAPAVAQNILSARDPGITAVYYLRQVKGWSGYVRAPGPYVNPGVEATNQYLLKTLMNGHQPTVVAFTRTDATFSSSATHWKADHGGATWQSQHIPLILSGPGIRAGQVLSQPAQLDDVAPTVLADMGVRPTGMEGQILTDALQTPAAADQQARAAEVRTAQPLVWALLAEDAYERAHPLSH